MKNFIEQEKIKATHNYIINSWEKTIVEGKNDYGIEMPYPYTSPCIEGMFKLQHYWDTFFINEGLLADGKIDLAKNNVNNLIYFANKYNRVPGSSCELHVLYSSQPPFLYKMIESIYNYEKDEKWLDNAVVGLEKEYNFWQTKRVLSYGLNGYFHNELSTSEHLRHYNNDCRERFPKLDLTISDSEKIKYSENAIAIVESGEDYSSRWNDGCINVVAVDLNANLYGLENFLFDYYTRKGNIDRANFFEKQMNDRKQKMFNICFDKESGLMRDYNLETKQHFKYMCASQFLPFLTGLLDDKKAYLKLLSTLEFEHGISATQDFGIKTEYQWDYPNMWAPHQYIAYMAGKGLGLKDEINRFAEKYLITIANTYAKTNKMWEKYDVNLGAEATQNEYEMPEMLGFTAGVFDFFYKELEVAKI